MLFPRLYFSSLPKLGRKKECYFILKLCQELAL